MSDIRAFLQRYTDPRALAGWRSVPVLSFFAVILAMLPEARALLATGLAGGVVLGLLLILARRHGGLRPPDRGTPIALFPRQVAPVRELFSIYNLTAGA